MENKVQQVQILGHTVNYISNTNSLIDPETIEEAIELGDKNGNLYKVHDLTFAPTGKWWITDWKEVATQLYNGIKQHTYQDTGTKDLINAVKTYEDATGK